MTKVEAKQCINDVLIDIYDLKRRKVSYKKRVFDLVTYPEYPLINQQEMELIDKHTKMVVKITAEIVDKERELFSIIDQIDVHYVEEVKA